MPETPCPCGSGKPYETCCGPALSQTRWPETAEALMRSRYTAHARRDIAWLRASLLPELQGDFDPVETATFATAAHWTGLTIRRTRRGQAGDSEGTVQFEARFITATGPGSLRENSLFRREGGRWYYVGTAPRLRLR